MRGSRVRGRLERAAPPLTLGDADDLGLHVALEAERGILPAEAGLLRAAERHERRRRAVLIDPSRADLEPRRDLGAAVQILRPDGAAQAVARVVGAAQRVLDVAELQDRHDRAELFLLNEPAVVGDVRDESRRQEVAGPGWDFAAR